MPDEIIIKYISNDTEKELNSINFDESYLRVAIKKFSNKKFKIFNLKPAEANILKQLCLSLGFDCAVNRNVITCKCEYSDCIINANKKQLIELSRKLNLQPFRLKELSDKIQELLSDKKTLIIRKKHINNDSKLVMGILNVTPDSFSDGGKFFSLDNAFSRAKEMINEGVDIIDIGGESTRPNAEIVDIKEEIKRVIPVIQNIRDYNKDIIISVDTRNFETAKFAIKAGADIVNDVSGLSDKNLLDFVAANNIPTIIMHSDKVPAKSSTETENSKSDIVEEIYISLHNKIQILKSKGMKQENIIIDVGIGFGKSPDDSFEILKRIDEFSSLNCLNLVGISRKSFISKTFNISKEELEQATLALDTVLLTRNVNILRVHDTSRHVKMLKYINKLI